MFCFAAAVAVAVSVYGFHFILLFVPRTIPCMLKKNHDRFKFSYGVPAQSGFVHKLSSTLMPSLVGTVPEI